MQQPLERIHRQNHHAAHRADPVANRISRLLDWVVSTGCAAHDGHNSLKRALHEHFGDASLLKDCHIIVASLRNVFDLILKHLPAWLERYVRFVDGVPDRDECFMLWTSLGVEGDIANLLADFRARWNGYVLLVHSDWEDDEEVFHNLSYCILALWIFRKFSDSRWLSVGTSCRAVVVALLLGLDSVLKYARRHPHSEEFIHGVDRLTNPVRKFMVLAGMISFVSQTFIVSVLENDAILTHLTELEEQVSGEVAWLVGLALAFWILLATVCDASGSSLRNDVIDGAFVSAGFIREVSE